MRAVRPDFSTMMAAVAPRLKDSRERAPEPPNSSRMVCFTRSGVGRTSKPFGTLRMRPQDLPPMMRMSGLALDEHPDFVEGHANENGLAGDELDPGAARWLLHVRIDHHDMSGVED